MVSAIFAAPFVRNVDIVVGTSPQFFTACAAYVIAKMRFVPWIFELRDIWPESIRAVGAMKESKVLDLLEKIELFLYRKSDAIVSVTNAFRDNLIGRGIYCNKINVVTNGVDVDRFKPRTKDAELIQRYGLDGKFLVGYIGTHGLAHALDTVLDAAKLLQQDPDGGQYCFILLGDGANKDALVKRSYDESIDNVIFVDSVSKDEVVRYWSILDVSIVHLKKNPLFSTVIPSKIFECMGMGIPVLHGVLGESEEIVEREQVGITFEPENATDLCENLRELKNNEDLYQRLKFNGPLAAKKYDRSVLAEKMLSVIEEQVSPIMKNGSHL